MRKSLLAMVVAAPLILGAPACAPTPQNGGAPRQGSATPSSKTLRPFKSERELLDFVQRMDPGSPPPQGDVDLEFSMSPPPAVAPPAPGQEAPPPPATGFQELVPPS
jgi:hypothetical protein